MKSWTHGGTVSFLCMCVVEEVSVTVKMKAVIVACPCGQSTKPKSLETRLTAFSSSTSIRRRRRGFKIEFGGPAEKRGVHLALCKKSKPNVLRYDFLLSEKRTTFENGCHFYKMFYCL